MLNRYAMPGPGPAKKRKGQVPFQGIAPRPSVFLWTLHGPRRFKGPVSSPPYASTSPQRRPLRARGSAGHTGGPVSYRPEGRNPPPWFSFSNSVVSSGPFKRQERTRSAVAALEVPHSRDWKWRTADWHPSTRHRSGLKVPPRPLSATGMPSAKCCAILTEERGGRPGNASSPLSFPPFGNPPFLIPPPNSNPPKGGKPQGALARRLLWRG